MTQADLKSEVIKKITACVMKYNLMPDILDRDLSDEEATDDVKVQYLSSIQTFVPSINQHILSEPSLFTHSASQSAISMPLAL